jgi:hypothetical protein
VGCWWLMLAILAIQDAEIRRTVVWSQPRLQTSNSSQDPVSKKSITKKRRLAE